MVKKEERVFTRSDSKYVVSTTTSPNKELDDILSHFARAMDEIPPDPRPLYPDPNAVKDVFETLPKTDFDKMVDKAVEAWNQAIEDYEPSDEELRQELELIKFIDG